MGRFSEEMDHQGIAKDIQAITHKGLLVVCSGRRETRDRLVERAWFIAKNAYDLRLRSLLVQYATMWGFRATMGCKYDKKTDAVLDSYERRMHRASEFSACPPSSAGAALPGTRESSLASP